MNRQQLLTPAVALIGAVLGAGLANTFLHWQSYADDLQFRTGTVTTNEVVSAVPGDGFIDIHLRGHKLLECKRVGLQAYTRDFAGVSHTAVFKRIDAEEPSQGRPVGGPYDFGTWRIVTSEGHVAALLYAQHDCGGHLRATKLAEVSIIK